eukprot:COSAG01_NODE_495_length_16308_cov_92.317088_2_plen_121_part_00
MATCSLVRAAVGVRGRFRGVGRGRGVQGRACSEFSGSPAMPDVGEVGRSMRFGCVRASEMTDRGGCVRCAGAGKSCAGGARAVGSAGGVGGAGVSVSETSDSGAVRWWAAVGGGRAWRLG